MSLGSEVVNSREEVIAKYVAAGDILDLGIVDSRRAVESTRQKIETFATSLHQHILGLNSQALGVDIDQEGIDLLKARGYNVVCADVETMELGRRFDAIVAGEIIEHLPNPGRALVCLRKHLKPTGRLILSTCNPFYIKQLWKILRFDDVQVHEEHTAWFDPHTLTRQLEMAGYNVERLCWVRGKHRHGRWKLWPAWLRRYFNATFMIVAMPRPASNVADELPQRLSA